jgi:hypothetical protein
VSDDSFGILVGLAQSVNSPPFARYMNPLNSFAPILTKLTPRGDFLTDRTWCDCHSADFYENGFLQTTFRRVRNIAKSDY